MKITSKKTKVVHDVQMDKARKRVIASIFGWLNKQGLNASMVYVKGIACQAAQVDEFNKISLNSLNRIYAEFKAKQTIQDAMLKHCFPVSLN